MIYSFRKLLSVVTTAGLLACGSSLEEDAQEIADLACEANKEYEYPETSMGLATDKMYELRRKSLYLHQKFMKKYTDPAEKSKFEQLVISKTLACK